MTEEVNVQEFPNPQQNYVLIKNPLFEKREEMKNNKQLPPAEQDKYITENLIGIFENLEILAVSPTIESAGTYRVGDRVLSTLQMVEQGVGVKEGKYILIRESSIVAKW